MTRSVILGCNIYILALKTQSANVYYICGCIKNIIYSKDGLNIIEQTTLMHLHQYFFSRMITIDVIIQMCAQLNIWHLNILKIYISNYYFKLWTQTLNLLNTSQTKLYSNICSGQKALALKTWMRFKSYLVYKNYFLTIYYRQI